MHHSDAASVIRSFLDLTRMAPALLAEAPKASAALGQIELGEPRV